MKLRKTEDRGINMEHAEVSHFTAQGLLNSTYKRTVKQNFKKACKKTLFGVRQHTKSPKLSKSTHTTSIALKISVFVSFALVACV